VRMEDRRPSKNCGSRRSGATLWARRTGCGERSWAGARGDGRDGRPAPPASADAPHHGLEAMGQGCSACCARICGGVGG
jgi:mono/diheme cytochrome c family protein